MKYPFSFSGTLVGALLVCATACLETHNNTQMLRGTDCAICHLDDFHATTAPSHAAPTVNFPTTCGDCHRPSAWRPALGGRHPAETVFPIQSGAHTNLACLKCHDIDRGPSQAGANTNCIQCHANTSDLQNAHVDAKSPTGVAYQYRADVPNFCLVCHPKGTAMAHPNNKFPRTGSHNVACTSCHDRKTGADSMGRNTTCIESGCHHTLSFSDAKHTEVRNYTASRNGPWSQPFITSRNFCLLCHPQGKN